MNTLIHYPLDGEFEQYIKAQYDFDYRELTSTGWSREEYDLLVHRDQLFFVKDLASTWISEEEFNDCCVSKFGDDWMIYHGLFA